MLPSRPVPRRILVVEDSQAMRSFVRAALEESLGDCEVVEARSGFDALRALPRGPYDLVITDIHMPDINGLELIRFLKESEAHRGTPLVIISTEAAAKDRERGLALGADDYLTKPFEPEALAAVVGRLLAGGRP